MTPRARAFRARRISRAVSAALWMRARIAAEEKREHPSDWLEVLGCAWNRAPRSLYAYAAVYDWARRMRVASLMRDLDFSFFDIASRYDGRVPDDDIRELLRTFANESGATLDSFRAELARLAAEPPPFAPLRWVERQRKALLDRADNMPNVAARDLVIRAADYLQRAADFCGDDPQGKGPRP